MRLTVHLEYMRDTISGHGTLAIGGTPITISFTVPRGECGTESPLKDVNGPATKVTDLAVARVGSGADTESVLVMTLRPRG